MFSKAGFQHDLKEILYFPSNFWKIEYKDEDSILSYCQHFSVLNNPLGIFSQGVQCTHIVLLYISFSISQTISFVPEPRHNEASLICEYRQLDGNGDLLFNDNAKHVLLKVKYVLDPDPLASSKTYSVKVSIYYRNSSSTTIFR